MSNMDVWDWVLLAIGAYVALTALVRLMRRRRDEVLRELETQAHAEQERKRHAEVEQKRRDRQQKRAA
jgi:hypothetical protein